MKRPVAVATVVLSLATIVVAQESVPLYPGPPPGSESWDHRQKQYHSPIFDTEVVTNVALPTLAIYLPEAEKTTGTSVIIAPGGGFHALSINSEGIDVARWLNERGVAAFVLRYRLVPTGEDGVREMLTKERAKAEADMAAILPLAVADGEAAVRLVRSRAAEWDLAADRIVLMGFSAGGAVAAGVVFSGDEASRPDYVAPIYAGAGNFDLKLPENAPPLFAVAATDDQLGLAGDSVKLYNAWLAAGRSAELHLYSKGGHGFGMREQGLPSDRWIERFGEWLEVQGLLVRN